MDLKMYYIVNFQLVHHHKWPLSDLESLMPWEREVYLGQLQTYIQQENDRIQSQMLKG
jgi:hypothetical protein